jgi:hypothetical protein
MLHKYDYKVLEDIHLRDYLLSLYLSRSKIYKWFLEKKVLVNGEFKNESFQLNK